MYVGTTDGIVLYFLLEANESPSGKLTYRCGLQARQGIGAKPIESIHVSTKEKKEEEEEETMKKNERKKRRRRIRIRRGRGRRRR